MVPIRRYAWLRLSSVGNRPAADADQGDARSQLEDLIQQIIERMTDEGYITAPPDLEGERERRQGHGGGQGPDQPPVTFEVTDKTLDFLGYRALRDLLGSLGKSSYGRHDTREQATGVETTGAPKPYEFGDTLNMDISGTLFKDWSYEFLYDLGGSGIEASIATGARGALMSSRSAPSSPSPRATPSRSSKPGASQMPVRKYKPTTPGRRGASVSGLR